MVCYFLNYMGPINKFWIIENGDYWACGRIDVSGVPNEFFGLEYNVPIMHFDDWRKLASWLNDYDTEELTSFQDLISAYEKENAPIRWFKKEE